MDKYLAYVDLLGFTTMIEKDFGRSKALLEDYYTIVYAVLEGTDAISGNLSSDCLLIYSDDYPILIDSLAKIYRECFYYNAASPEFYLLPRGALSRGFMEIGARDTSIKLTRDFMIGTALVHSSKLEQQIKGSRLLFAVNTSESSFLNESEAGIRAMIYENCAFKFWDQFSYYDILWPLDMSKNIQQQKCDVRELLEIALSLLQSNSSNLATLNHYTHTVRLCLLSYSMVHINAVELYAMVIDDFSEDHYWLVWLTVLEILATPSLQQHLIPVGLIKKLRSLCLNPGWVDVIGELQRPGKNYIRMRILDFLNP